MQAVGYANRIFGERDARAEVDGAVIAAVDGHSGIAERDRAQRMSGARGVALCGGNRAWLGAHEPGFTLAVLRSRKSRIRRFASLSLCATVAISDSIKSPVCGLASAIIGSACNTAKLVSGALAATRSASSSAFGSACTSSARYCEKP